MERYKEAGRQQLTLDKLTVGRNHLEQPLHWLMGGVSVAERDTSQ